MQKSTSSKIMDALIAQKVLTEDQASKVTKEQHKKGTTFLEALGDLGFVAPDVLLEIASSEFDIPAIRLSKCKIPSEVLALLPKKVAFSHQVLPLSKIGDVITVAISDPMNMIALDNVERVTGLKPSPILSTKQEILENVDAQYSEDASKVLRDVVKDMEFEDITVVRDETDLKVTDVSELMNLTQEEPVVRLTDHILSEGIRRGASDIFIEPQERNLVVRYRVDGILREGPKPPQTTHQGVVSRIKIMSNLNIAEHRLPQDGRFKLKGRSGMVDFRVSTIPTYLGEKVCLRILDPSQAKLTLEGLGFSKDELGKLREASDRPHGMILVCGPTGSGKTTTLYSVLSHLNTTERNLVTIEDPVEYSVQGINQVNTRSDVGLTFASALRSILRQDPDVILVGEIRDKETADVAVKAALTGHLVLSTLHTNTAVGAITRLINLSVEPFLLTSTLILTGSQRLIRKICSQCREKYKPSPELRKKFHLKASENLVLYRAKGCEKCFQTGYLGRICIAELLTITPSVRELILNRAPEGAIKEAACKGGMVTLRESAVAKLVEGVTTADEVLRLTMPDEENKA